MLLWLIVGTFGFGLVMGLVATMVDPLGRRRVVTRAFWCPFRDRAVSAEFEVEEWTLRPTDVRSCSAFDPPERVSCHKPCRDLPLAVPAVRR
jgi:hypothetical protein